MLGAGAVGTAVGGRLALGGAEVVLVGRPWLRERLADGLRLSRWGEPEVRVPAARLRVETDREALAEVDLVLVTTKSRDTRAAAEGLPGVTPVVSLQNGVRNVDLLRAALPGRAVWPGMVPFNVVWTADGRVHQGTSGPIVVAPEARALVDAIRAGGGDALAHPDVRAVQWGKLLLNLNNAVNALSGLPLRAQLSDRRWRSVLADVIDEGRAVVRAAGVRARGVGLLRPGLAPTVLRLPDVLFFRVAGAMVRIDPQARSSMADDLDRGRPTEVDELNGEITRLGPAPLNARLVALVRQAEAGGPRGLGPEQVRGGGVGRARA